VKKVLIVNEGLSNNLGDQAIRVALEEALGERGYDVSFGFYSNPKLQSVSEAIESDSSGKSRFARLKRFPLLVKFNTYLNIFRWYFRNRKHIADIVQNEQYNVIIIGGGQLINSAPQRPFNIFALAIFLWTSLAKKYSKARLCILGVGVAGEFHKLEKFFYRRALKKCDKILVRDNFSAQSLKSNFSIVSEVYPDLAFYLAGKSKISSGRKFIGLGIYNYAEYKTKFESRDVAYEAYYKTWEDLVIPYFQEGLDVKLFATTKGDHAETVRFQGYLQSKGYANVVVADISSLTDLDKFLDDCKVVISGRMHALILSLNHLCSVHPFLVNKKLEVFAREYLEGAVDVLALKRGVEDSLSICLSE
jgi:polysaccharide pyruvyl transferase WcaK-like protein